MTDHSPYYYGQIIQLCHFWINQKQVSHVLRENSKCLRFIVRLQKSKGRFCFLITKKKKKN